MSVILKQRIQHKQNLNEFFLRKEEDNMEFALLSLSLSMSFSGVLSVVLSLSLSPLSWYFSLPISYSYIPLVPLILKLLFAFRLPV